MQANKQQMQSIHNNIRLLGGIINTGGHNLDQTRIVLTSNVEEDQQLIIGMPDLPLTIDGKLHVKNNAKSLTHGIHIGTIAENQQLSTNTIISCLNINAISHFPQKLNTENLDSVHIKANIKGIIRFGCATQFTNIFITNLNPEYTANEITRTVVFGTSTTLVNGGVMTDVTMFIPAGAKINNLMLNEHSRIFVYDPQNESIILGQVCQSNNQSTINVHTNIAYNADGDLHVEINHLPENKNQLNAVV